MTEYPINYTFCSKQRVTVTQDGKPKEITVLSLDEKANDAYWEKIDRFKYFITNAPEDDPITLFEFNKKFIDLATIDVTEDDKIAGIPITVLNDEDEANCLIYYKSGAYHVF